MATGAVDQGLLQRGLIGVEVVVVTQPPVTAGGPCLPIHASIRVPQDRLSRLALRRDQDFAGAFL